MRKTFDEQALRGMTQSVRQLGIMQPIVVRLTDESGTYSIVAGERRFRAAVAAGLKEVPCWVRSASNNDLLLHQVSENWQRADLEPLELARALAALKDARQCSQAELAHLIGKPKSEISKFLAMVNRLDPGVQTIAEEADAGLGKRHLYAISQLPAQQQKQLVQHVRRRALTADATEDLVAQQLRRLSGVTHERRAATIRRFRTSVGTLSFTGRPGRAQDDDVLTALDEVRSQLRGE